MNAASTSGPPHAQIELWQQHAPAESERADVAIAAALQHADPRWLALAEQAVRELAMAEGTFTADDVWTRIGTRAHTHERRAMGGVMRGAHRSGLIRPTGTWCASQDQTASVRAQREWRGSQQ